MPYEPLGAETALDLPPPPHEGDVVRRRRGVDVGEGYGLGRVPLDGLPTATMPKFRPSFCSLALRPLESQYVSVPLLVMVTLTPLSARAALNWSQLLAVLHALATAFLMDSL